MRSAVTIEERFYMEEKRPPASAGGLKALMDASLADAHLTNPQAKNLALLFLLRGLGGFLGLRFGLGFCLGLFSGRLRRFFGRGFLRGGLGRGLRRSSLGRFGGLGGRSLGRFLVALFVADDQFLFFGFDDVLPAEFVVLFQPGQLVFFKIVLLEIHSVLPRGYSARGIAPGDAGWHVSSRCRCNGRSVLRLPCYALQSPARCYRTRRKVVKSPAAKSSMNRGLQVGRFQMLRVGLRPNRNTAREAVRMEAAELGVACLQGAGLQDAA